MVEASPRMPCSRSPPTLTCDPTPESVSHTKDPTVNSRPIDELQFVYDADSGFLSALVDSARKLLAINDCPLCALTHSLAGERAEWTECKAALGVPVRYVHRDELTATLRLAIAGSLPCVLARVGTEMTVLLHRESLIRCNGKVADLRGRLRHQATLRGLSLPPMT